MENNNSFTLKIENCMDCDKHVCTKYYTADWFDEEIACICTMFPEEQDKNVAVKGRLVAETDRNLERLTKIPNWCPRIQ